jgi:hypothetical protein
MASKAELKLALERLSEIDNRIFVNVSGIDESAIIYLAHTGLLGFLMVRCVIYSALAL